MMFLPNLRAIFFALFFRKIVRGTFLCTSCTMNIEPNVLFQMSIFKQHTQLEVFSSNIHTYTTYTHRHKCLPQSVRTL